MRQIRLPFLIIIMAVPACTSLRKDVWYRHVKPAAFDVQDFGSGLRLTDDTFPKESLCPITREQALAHLLGCKTFADSAVGDGGDESLQVRAFRVLLKQPDTALIYRNLLDRGGLTGQLYALCGLRLADRALFEIEIKRYEHMQIEIWTQFGCTRSKQLISEIVVSKNPCALRLRPGQTPKQWADKNHCKSYYVDIVGGGYSWEFSNTN